jgi:hypothetical protein
MNEPKVNPGSKTICPRLCVPKVGDANSRPGNPGRPSPEIARLESQFGLALDASLLSDQLACGGGLFGAIPDDADRGADDAADH